MPLAALGIIGAVGSIGGAMIGSGAASDAANAQEQASEYAANLQKQESDAALAFQQQQWNTEQQNMAPWLQSGSTALNQIMGLMGLAPPSMQSPTMTPAGQARANMGLQPFPGQITSSSPLTTMPNYTSAGGSGGPIMRQSPGGSGWGGPPTSGSMPIAYPGGSAGGPPRATTGLNNISTLASMAPGGNTNGSQFVPFAPWTQTFQAPTNVTEANDPGYQFRLSQGEQALDRGAAANGTLLSGAGIKPYERFAQDYASNEYGNVYNRELNNYELGYNQFENNQTNQWNRLAALSGLGQTTASQLGSFGNQVGSNVSNIDLATGQMLGQDANNAGAARASGYIGSGNAWSGAVSGGTNNLMNLLMLQQMQGGGGGGYNYPPEAYS